MHSIHQITQNEKDNIIYWVTTGLIGSLMLFSDYSYFANPMVVDGFKQTGFPDFFRVELGIAKIIGAIVLLIPQLPTRVKEWAYAGLGITFISAAITHIAIGDPASKAVAPLVFLAILIVSNIYLHKIKGAN